MFNVKRTAAVVIASASLVSLSTTYAVAGSATVPSASVVTFSYAPQFASDYAGLTNFAKSHCMDYKHDASNAATYTKLENKLNAKLSSAHYFVAGQNGQLEQMVAPSYAQLTNALLSCPKG